MTVNDETTGRFEVVESGTRYRVRDHITGGFLRFSYDRNAIPFADENNAALWGNFYSARGFAQKMARYHADPISNKRRSSRNQPTQG